jgi:O-antigen/teichoic acid export membrane protein
MINVPFIQGATAMGCIVAAAFFLRFWHQSRDRLFVRFSTAFVLLAVSYLLLATIAYATEWRVYIFALRLLAFVVIIYGIFEKNRR